MAEAKTISADAFHDEHSGRGTNSSQVTFQQLGIAAKEAMQVSIQHPPANIAEETLEIPGDEVVVKDKNTIVFSVCGIYFEAQRRSPR